MTDKKRGIHELYAADPSALTKRSGADAATR